MAVRRLEALERKLKADPPLAEQVRQQIAGYEHKGYAHKASLTELTSTPRNRVWYLPIGVVTSPRKPNKIRLIWDAAAKVGHVSFNSQLLKSLNAASKSFMPIPTISSGSLWRPDGNVPPIKNQPSDYPQIYIMDVATFGSTCSPASAQYVKNQNAKELSNEFPRAAEAIIHKHYVDDYLDSFRTVQEAIEVVNEVKTVHSRGGFKMRHFLSNKAEVLREWRWIPTKLNIADQATKWNSGPRLSTDNPWFRGPNFLYEEEGSWPIQRLVAPTTEELRSDAIILCHHTPRLDIPIDVSRFNSWTRIQRTVAFVLRYVDNCRRRKRHESLQLGVLTQDELKRAEELLWKVAQKEVFAEELSILAKSQGPPEKRHCTVSRSSSIYKTWPFMDDRGILRMRGRIGMAPYIPKEAKFPAILPRNHPITFLIIDWYHRRFNHANRETVVNEIRQRFEIPKLRSIVEKIAKNCVPCRIFKAAPNPPPMASLPAVRLTSFVRPFSFVGLDYFGPVFVRVGRSLAKRWIALFTCLTVRAVHMEVVHSLSTVSCIMVVRRFVARRGPPREFYSDNGTCFQGASKELKKEIEKRNDALASTFTSAETSWKFIPPAAPHMGGVWERLVRSVKVATGAVLDATRKPPWRQSSYKLRL
ncbi:uncharacterized protein LOC129773807 [Toxorhynchites rutilus septentrionalis]|uniref:uncharacterized protein LOC129773807 n=1 Tax=Toxorhynchites rutilus septentrionalis TaxID=329112 RepID=UPI0024787782|nr:uncharacterized protein LOC129773807 [Toxorhynchites rutilus septentrionalis]